MRRRVHIIFSVAFFVIILAKGSFSASVQEVPLIFNATESAKPGEVIGLQGANFGANPEVWLWFTPIEGKGSTPTPSIQLQVLKKSETYVSAVIPSNDPLGIYAVWVKANGVFSDVAYVNRARIQWSEFPEIDPGRSFRLFGRNLSLPGYKASIQFADSLGNSLAGTIESGDTYVLKVKAPPTLIPGRIYTIYFSNGAGGPLGKVSAPDPLVARTGGIDVFDLKVPWEADFAPFASNVYNVKTDSRLGVRAAGDGVADDTAAIQKAINRANADGGGVVYLPAGTYRIATFGGTGGGVALTMKSNVVLKGDSQAKTILAIEAPINITAHTANIVFSPESSVMGFLDLTIKVTTQITEPSPGNHYYLVGTRTTVDSNPSKLFFLRVTFDQNKWGGGLRLSTATGGRFLIADSIFKNSRKDRPHLITKDFGSDVNSARYIYIRNNSFPNFNVGLLIGGRNIIYEGNDLVYDGDYYNQINALQPSFSDGYGTRDRINVSGPNIVVLNNTFRSVGASITGNDGENILAEDSGTESRDTGIVTSAAATTLTDSGKAWGVNAWADFDVMLIDGTGRGQWRRIISNTATVLTLESAWTLTPGGGAKYTIMKLNVPHLLVKDNTIRDKRFAMSLYEGAYDVAFVGNTVINSGEVWVRAEDDPLASWFNPVLNVLIADNTITATSIARSSIVDIRSFHSQKTRSGVGIFLVEVRRNIVTSKGLEAFRAIAEYSYGGAETHWHPAGSSPPAAIEGIIFDGNTAIEAATAYGWIPGVEGVVVANYIDKEVIRTTYDLNYRDGLLSGGISYIAGVPALGSDNRALSFDGTGVVGLGKIDLRPLTLPTVLTAEGWFRTTGSHIAILSNRNVGATVIFVGWSGRLSVWDNRFGSSGVLEVASPLVNDGQWHHFAWTTNGTTHKLYLDGALKTTATKARIGSTGGGKIGQDGAGGANPFIGDIDEIRIWSVVRTADEIQANMNRELTGREPDLIQYWKFNERRGIIVKNEITYALPSVTVAAALTSGTTLFEQTDYSSSYSWSGYIDNKALLNPISGSANQLHLKVNPGTVSAGNFSHIGLVGIYKNSDFTLFYPSPEGIATSYADQSYYCFKTTDSNTWVDVILTFPVNYSGIFTSGDTYRPFLVALTNSGNSGPCLGNAPTGQGNFNQIEIKTDGSGNLYHQIGNGI